jgi:hypothetical protein
MWAVETQHPWKAVIAPSTVFDLGRKVASLARDINELAESRPSRGRELFARESWFRP